MQARQTKLTPTRPGPQEPIIGPDGFDQYGLGPLTREFQQRAGIYPTVPKRLPRVTSSAYGGREREPIVVQVKVDVSGLATRAELAECRRYLDAVADAVVTLEQKVAAA